MTTHSRSVLVAIVVITVANSAGAAEPVLRAYWQTCDASRKDERRGVAHMYADASWPIPAGFGKANRSRPAVEADLRAQRLDFFLVYSKDEIDHLPRLAALESGLLDVMSRVATLSAPATQRDDVPAPSPSFEALSARLHELETEVTLLRARVDELRTNLPAAPQATPEQTP